MQSEPRLYSAPRFTIEQPEHERPYLYDTRNQLMVGKVYYDLPNIYRYDHLTIVVETPYSSPDYLYHIYIGEENA